MRFFGESMIQNYKIFPIPKAQYSENIIALLHPNLPNLIGTFELLKIISRHNIDLFNEIKDKRNFFKLFVRKRIKIFFHWALAHFGSIKLNFSHT